MNIMINNKEDENYYCKNVIRTNSSKLVFNKALSNNLSKGVILCH